MIQMLKKKVSLSYVRLIYFFSPTKIFYNLTVIRIYVKVLSIHSISMPAVIRSIVRIRHIRVYIGYIRCCIQTDIMLLFFRHTII